MTRNFSALCSVSPKVETWRFSSACQNCNHFYLPGWTKFPSFPLESVRTSWTIPCTYLPSPIDPLAGFGWRARCARACSRWLRQWKGLTSLLHHHAANRAKMIAPSPLSPSFPCRTWSQVPNRFIRSVTQTQIVIFSMVTLLRNSSTKSQVRELF